MRCAAAPRCCYRVLPHAALGCAAAALLLRLRCLLLLRLLRPLLSRLPVRTSPLYMSGEEAITHSVTIERRTGGQKGIPRAGVQGGSFG